MLITNAFSLNMLDPQFAHSLIFQPMDEGVAQQFLSKEPVTSAIGHPATASVLSARLGMDIPFNRTNVSLERGQEMIVAQVALPRLAEGQVLSHEEMEQVKIQYWLVSSVR